MSTLEHIDPDCYEDKLSAIEAAMVGARSITICRGDWALCPDGEVCPMCLRVDVVPGLSAMDVLRMSKGHTA